MAEALDAELQKGFGGRRARELEDDEIGALIASALDDADTGVPSDDSDWRKLMTGRGT